MTDDTLTAFQLVVSRSLARCAATQPDPQAFLDEQREAILKDAAEVQHMITDAVEREKLAARLEAMFQEAAV